MRGAPASHRGAGRATGHSRRASAPLTSAAAAPTGRLASTPNSPPTGSGSDAKRVARLMRQMGLAGVSRRKGTRTTRRNAAARPAADLVERRFEADAPNRLWVADITYVPTWTGLVFLAVVVDVFSRRVVGWSMATHLRTELVLDALNMALSQRRPERVIHHCDQGSQYTSYAFAKRCRERGVVASMGSLGDCYDNAMAESFFATLECELLDRHRFATQAEAAGPSSSTSKGGITPTGATPASVTDPPSTSRGAANPPIECQAMNRPRKRGNSKQFGLCGGATAVRAQSARPRWSCRVRHRRR